jgi:hypothetical protein
VDQRIRGTARINRGTDADKRDRKKIHRGQYGGLNDQKKQVLVVHIADDAAIRALADGRTATVALTRVRLTVEGDDCAAAADDKVEEIAATESAWNSEVDGLDAGAAVNLESIDGVEVADDVAWLLAENCVAIAVADAAAVLLQVEARLAGQAHISLDVV